MRRLATALLCPALYMFSAGTTIALAALLRLPVQPLVAGTSLWFLLAGLGLVTAMGITRLCGSSSRSIFLCAWLFWFGCWGLALLNVEHGLVSLHQYGDKAAFPTFLTWELVLPKWFLGQLCIHFVYALVEELPPILRALFACLESAPRTAALLGALTMAAASLYMARRRRTRLSVMFTVFTPVWLTFSSGYVEYYPFIAWLIPAVFLWLFAWPLTKRSPYHVGTVAAVLPLVYVGFLPLTPILLVFYTMANIRRGLRALATCVCAAFIIISCSTMVIRMSSCTAMCIPWGRGISFYRVLGATREKPRANRLSSSKRPMPFRANISAMSSTCCSSGAVSPAWSCLGSVRAPLSQRNHDTHAGPIGSAYGWRCACCVLPSSPWSSLFPGSVPCGMWTCSSPPTLRFRSSPVIFATSSCWAGKINRPIKPPSSRSSSATPWSPQLTCCSPGCRSPGRPWSKCQHLF